MFIVPLQCQSYLTGWHVPCRLSSKHFHFRQLKVIPLFRYSVLPLFCIFQSPRSKAIKLSQIYLYKSTFILTTLSDKVVQKQLNTKCVVVKVLFVPTLFNNVYVLTMVLTRNPFVNFQWACRSVISQPLHYLKKLIHWYTHAQSKPHTGNIYM